MTLPVALRAPQVLCHDPDPFEFAHGRNDDIHPDSKRFLMLKSDTE